LFDDDGGGVPHYCYLAAGAFVGLFIDCWLVLDDIESC